MEIEKLIALIDSKDNNSAWEATSLLEEESIKNNLVYKYFDKFAEMMKSKKSYERNRGLVLIAANAQWDKENKIEGIIDDFLKHITDEKPITSRQCIKLLPKIIEHKPNLSKRIIDILEEADLQKYNDSMKSLIEKDIDKVLNEIKAK